MCRFFYSTSIDGAFDVSSVRAAFNMRSTEVKCSSRDVNAVYLSKELSYHWREVPQVSFLSHQTRVCRDKHIFVATIDVFCRDETVFTTKIILMAALANDTVQLSFAA